MTIRPQKNRLPKISEQLQAKTEDSDEQVRMAKIAHLSAMELFRDLTSAEIKEIERAVVMLTCKSGEIFFRPGETGEVLFFLKKGAVQIYRESAKRRKLVIDNLRPYAIFGEMACLGQGMYSRFAMTTEESLVCFMKRVDMERLLLSKPRVALRLIQLIGERSVRIEERLEEFAFKEAKSRVAAFLLRTADGDELNGMRHQDIADTLGIFRETVADALAELKASGIIDIERRRIAILNRKRLEDRAG